MNDETDLRQAILDGLDKDAGRIALSELGSGRDPLALVNELLIPAMEEVGRRFESGEYFIPEMLLSARAMKAAMQVIQPRLAERGCKPTGRVVIGTVQGDLHDIGKNLVASMLEGGGFEVHDLGADVSPEKFVQAVKQWSPDIVGMSALLTTTMPSMKRTLEALHVAGLRESVHVMVGGAPVTVEFSDSIGADGYAPSAGSAVGLARDLLKK